MKNIAFVTLAAPLALALAGCGDNQAEDTAANDITAAIPAPTAPVVYAPVGASARTTVKYDGTYTQTAADGTTRSVTLNAADDSYAMTDATGVETKGKFNWYSDNSRILIKNSGKTWVFGIADGVIYELENAETPLTATGAANAFVRR